MSNRNWLKGLNLSAISPGYGTPLCPTWCLRLCHHQPQHPYLSCWGTCLTLFSLYVRFRPRLWAPWGQKPGLICLVFPMPSTRPTQVTTQYVFVFWKKEKEKRSQENKKGKNIGSVNFFYLHGSLLRIPLFAKTFCLLSLLIYWTNAF